jgi:esterase/lipase superfamily enzyme
MKCSASLSFAAGRIRRGGLAISSRHHQDARASLMNERYIRWYTPWLSREFEMLVSGDKRGLPLIIFPISGARYYENKDFKLAGSVASYVDKGINRWLDDRKWRGHDWNYWQGMLPYHLSLL